MSDVFIVIPFVGIISFLLAVLTSAQIGKRDAGTAKMREIAQAISEGAHAFLKAEYRVLIIFAIAMFFIIGIGLGSFVTAICFLIGGLFSTAAGYLGMTSATKANVRTAQAAREGGRPPSG